MSYREDRILDEMAIDLAEEKYLAAMDETRPVHTGIIFTGADRECKECYGYGYHLPDCDKVF